MKPNFIRLVSLSFLLGISSPFVWAQDKQDGTGEIDDYKLVWQDLFDNGVLNEKDNWSVEVNGDGGGNRELQYYRRENISFGKEPMSGNNCLIITAQKENFGGKNVTSGRLTTQRKMSFKHGKVEACIKFPRTANGLWPAFWLLGNTNSTEGWPRCGEIDILEMGHANGIKNNTQDRYFNGACHWGYYEDGWYPNYAKDKTSDYGLQDEFHLFTMTWDENKIQMYLDKDKYPDVQPYYAMDISGIANPKDPGNYFHRQFFVIFNLAVGGNFPGIWDINKITALTNGNAKMYVDYVKVYQKGSNDEEFFGAGSSTFVSSYNADQPKMNYDALNKCIIIEREVRHFSLFSLNGITVLNERDSNLIDLSRFQSGIYIAKIEMEDGTIVSEKFYLK